MKTEYLPVSNVPAEMLRRVELSRLKRERDGGLAVNRSEEVKRLLGEALNLREPLEGPAQKKGGSKCGRKS